MGSIKMSPTCSQIYLCIDVIHSVFFIALFVDGGNDDNEGDSIYIILFNSKHFAILYQSGFSREIEPVGVKQDLL